MTTAGAGRGKQGGPTADELMADRQRKHSAALDADQAQGAAARGMSKADFVRSEMDKASNLIKEDSNKLRKGEQVFLEDSSMKKGGKVSSASKRADGIAVRGKTRGKMY